MSQNNGFGLKASANGSLIDRSTEVLSVNDKLIQRVARERFGDLGVAGIVVKQAIYEGIARFRTHVSFRSNENDEAVKAYCAMNLKEFEGINARQAWANWRTVPKNLNGSLPNHPVKAIDLCCGTGQSTQVLSYYLAPGSSILGLEYNEGFVKLAGQRSYQDENGDPVNARFNAQSVLEKYRDPEGNLIEAESIDLVNCCGAFGHHFKPASTREAALEINRVLKPGGLALIDSGPHGTQTDELIRIFQALGFEVRNKAKSCFADLYIQVCFKKSEILKA